jgi:carboxyl-terminal processing protease
MNRFQKHARVAIALACLASAFLVSVQFGDRGVQFKLKTSAGAANDKKDDNYDLSSLKILNRVLLQIKDNYVEPDRIKPAKMLVSALDEIQNAIAEVVVDYDRADPNKTPDVIKVTVRDQSKSFDVKGIQSLWEMSFKLKEIFSFIQSSLGKTDDVKFQDVEYAAINGLLSTLDPHSNLLPPVSYEEMQTQTGGQFGGLGIVIGVRDGMLTVISPIQGTPAAKAGIKSGDQITRIGEESTVNMNLNDAVGMMRGEVGTKIELYVQRKGWTEPKKFTIERAIIKIESVSSQALANKVAYIRVKNFQANTYSDTKKQLDALRTKMGGVQGVVLDLRDNPGGLLDQAIRLSDLFVDEGTIVSTVGQGNKIREKKMAISAGTEPKYPIIVLVNPGSASASEIVAGALRNNDRALVVGDTTFGKGSVQVLYEFPDRSALKLTIAQYLTPGDISIQGRGIRPDLRVMPVTIDKNNVDMFVSNNVLREGDLAEALTNDASSTEKDDARLVRYYKKTDKKAEEAELADPDEFKEDFEIKLAQRLITSADGAWERPKLLKAVQKELDKVDDQEMSLIGAEFKRLNVSWAKGASAKAPAYDLKVTTSSADGMVKAGDKVTLTAAFTNKGTEPLYQVKAITEADYNVFNDREFIFGKVDPGKTVTWSVEVQAPRDAPDREDFVKFVVSDNTTELGKDQGANIRTVSQERPHFAFSYDILDKSGDGLMQAGEDVTVKIWVENNGKTDSAETQIYLKNLSHEAIYLKNGRAKLNKIPAGKQEAVEFTFQVKKAPEDNMATLEVDVYDATYREFTQAKILVPFTPTPGSPTKSSGLATVKKGDTKIHVAADAKSDTLAIADANATLPVTGALGGWFKVDVNGRAGWVAAADVDQKSGAGKLSGIRLMSSFQAPTMLLTPAQMMTDGATINLDGALSDPSGVKDYYIFVYGRSNNMLQSRKVLYSKAAGEQVALKAAVPLFKGMNRIVVYARDTQGMLASESAYVYRK